MKRLIEIVSWMALFFVLVFAFVEYTKQNQGPLPAIARFNPEIRALENGQFLNAKRRPIEVTWRFLRKTQDGVVAEALSGIEQKKAEGILLLLNKVAGTQDPESHPAILFANMQIWMLLREESDLPVDIEETNKALAVSAIGLIESGTGDANAALMKLAESGALVPSYVETLVRQSQN